MADSVIRVDNLGKRYELGEIVSARRALRRAGKALGLQPSQASGDDQLWALRNVSFEVKRGEVLGIIGRNGAGKSTLLKILSRVTKPTEGYAELRGRVGSLLEVGTGFHPELTGRDNIYLNGAILGMKKREIDRRLDEIIDFSGVEKFLDTPVKRYSSGMYTRLAFAVAAHLETEILICDEVLAVGDAEFQKRCLGKMHDVSRGGERTILFVSHNMAAIKFLCNRSVLLANGSVQDSGDTDTVIQGYLNNSTTASTFPAGNLDLRKWPQRRGTGEARVVAARLKDAAGDITATFVRTLPLHVEFDIEGHYPHSVNLSMTCFASDGTKILHLSHYDSANFNPGLISGIRTFQVTIPSLPLAPGSYYWAIGMHSRSFEAIDVVLDILPFTVIDDIRLSTRPFPSTSDNGYCIIPSVWRTM